MRLRKKKTPPEAPPGPVSVLYLLEAIRIAVLAGNAGSGTQDSVKLRVASDALAERALSCPTAENS